MTDGVDYRWRLRERMAQQGIFSASELSPHLAAHGVHLSSSQVWRLVTGRPERLNLTTLVVLCEILDCTPNDLIEQVDFSVLADRAGRCSRGPVSRML